MGLHLKGQEIPVHRAIFESSGDICIYGCTLGVRTHLLYGAVFKRF